MSSLSELRKKRKGVGALADKINQTRQVDERFWQATRDKQGNANTIIRFLPQQDLEGNPWTQYFDHFFKTDKGYFVEKCPTTLGEDCPVCQANGKHWDDAGGEPSLVPEYVKARSRKYHYVANILVIKDPANPANEGKVFLFKFGKSIFNMIKACIKPEFDDEMPIDPFDVDEGANFNFKIIKKGEYPNYDKSSFQAPSALYEDDQATLEKVVESLYPIKEFKYESEMKSYDELAVLFHEKTGEGAVNEEVKESANKAAGFDDELDDLVEKVEEKAKADESTLDDDVTDFSGKFDNYFGDDD